eukprot:TRINITY_DN430_c0_g1_i1.p1 TRINITY_DN430_c0_g1~~TRINITY_DN430_c0_g1_i1.p1  ORF type:complete len:276 (-),score=81.53 TRINITY_DN430_c0_g1_i1:113-940(-)
MTDKDEELARKEEERLLGSFSRNKRLLAQPKLSSNPRQRSQSAAVGVKRPSAPTTSAPTKNSTTTKPGSTSNWRLQRQLQEEEARKRERELQLEKEKKIRELASQKSPERELKYNDRVLNAIAHTYVEDGQPESPSPVVPLAKAGTEEKVASKPPTTETSKDEVPDIIKVSEVAGITEEEREELEMARLSKFLKPKIIELSEEEILQLRKKQEEELKQKAMQEKAQARLRSWETKKAEEEYQKKKEEFHTKNEIQNDDTLKKKAAASNIADLLGI